MLDKEKPLSSTRMNNTLSNYSNEKKTCKHCNYFDGND